MPEEDRPIEDSTNESLEGEVVATENSNESIEDLKAKIKDREDRDQNQLKSYEEEKGVKLGQLKDELLRKHPRLSEDELDLLANNVLGGNLPIEEIPHLVNHLDEITPESFHEFQKKKPRRDIHHLADAKSAKIRWVTDIQDFGAAQHNLKVLEKIIHDSKELDPEKSMILFGGDAFYDFHLENMMVYDPNAVEDLHFQFISKGEAKAIKDAVANEPDTDKAKIMKGQSLRRAVFNEYTRRVDKMLSDLDPELARGHIVGNNEAFPLMQQGYSTLQSRDVFNQKLSFSKDMGLDKEGKESPFFKVAGVKAFSAEYWEPERDRVITERDPTNGTVIAKNTALYDQLKEEKPTLLTLHGQPTFFYKGKTTWKELEPDGLSRYLDEYEGDDPMYVMCGHAGHQGIVRKTNSNGSEVIMLNSNLHIDHHNQDEKARAITYDLNIENQKISSVDVKTYEFNT